jgi:DNA topoisomerase I
VTAAQTLITFGPPRYDDTGKPITKAELKHREAQAVKAAAAVLYNTPATCRKFYVHPQLIEAYADGRLGRAFAKAGRQKDPRELSTPERGVLVFLRMVQPQGRPHANGR